jgi:nucleotide-binding universal stress UspA family protein
MPKPILVGYEPNTLDQAPVRFGAEAARFTGAPLIVACVVHDAGALERLGAGQVDEELSADAGGALEDVRAALTAEGIAVQCREIRALSVPRALHDTAVAEDAGLLVAGSRRDGTLGSVLPGTTVERLMHGAPCPIAVVPSGWETRGGLQTIGVAYVESDEGREALRGAHALARRADTTLRVLTVVKPSFAMYMETEPRELVYPPRTVEDVEGEHRVWAERALEAAVAALDGQVRVETEAFVDEDPADTLVRVSEHLDLLVCGSRGYGPVRAVLLGGVSRRIAAAAHCPVIVLPRGVRASLEALMEEAGAPAAG